MVFGLYCVCMHSANMLELCTLAITLTLDILFMRDCDIAYARVLSLLYACECS